MKTPKMVRMISSSGHPITVEILCEGMSKYSGRKLRLVQVKHTHSYILYERYGNAQHRWWHFIRAKHDEKGKQVLLRDLEAAMVRKR